MRHKASILCDRDSIVSKYSEGVDHPTVGISRGTIQQNLDLAHPFKPLTQKVTCIDPVDTDVPTAPPCSIFPQKAHTSPQRTHARGRTRPNLANTAQSPTQSDSLSRSLLTVRVMPRQQIFSSGTTSSPLHRAHFTGPKKR
jgi:hypothetical protein